MTTWNAFDRALSARRREIVERFIPFLRVATVSQDPPGVRAGAEWLVAAMRARGLEARIIVTGGNPAVFGELRVPGASRGRC